MKFSETDQISSYLQVVVEGMDNSEDRKRDIVAVWNKCLMIATESKIQYLELKDTLKDLNGQDHLE